MSVGCSCSVLAGGSKPSSHWDAKLLFGSICRELIDHSSPLAPSSVQLSIYSHTIYVHLIVYI